MGLKEFLKSDKRTIIVFVILLIIFLIPLGTFDVSSDPSISHLIIIGFPLPAYICVERVSALPSQSCEILFPSLIIDLVVLYPYSCLIIWVYDKYKKKSGIR